MKRNVAHILSIVFALHLFGIALNAHAQTIEDVDCSEGGSSTVEMKYCAHLEYQAADAELNSVYQELLAEVRESGIDDNTVPSPGPELRKKLIESEKIWIKLRDANCDAEAATFWGGTGYGLIYTTCLTRETRQRTQFLEDFLTNYFDR